MSWIIKRKKPTIVCLCGSTKFKQEFIKTNFKLTMDRVIVLSVGWFSHADSDTYYPTDEEKKALDELHFRKIDLADEVVVINVDGYIGESTRNEIEYAKKLGKRIIYLYGEKPQPDKPPVRETPTTEMSKTVTEIVKDWLTEHGYDGLFCGIQGGECSCRNIDDDLFPCSCEGALSCEPGYIHTKDCHCSNCDKLDFTSDGDEVDWIMSDKPVVRDDPTTEMSSSDCLVNAFDALRKASRGCWDGVDATKYVDKLRGYLEEPPVRETPTTEWEAKHDIDTSGMTAVKK